jgi:hypothetical protein
LLDGVYSKEVVEEIERCLPKVPVKDLKGQTKLKQARITKMEPGRKRMSDKTLLEQKYPEQQQVEPEPGCHFQELET